jgi:flagellar biosynthetic protein FliR
MFPAGFEVDVFLLILLRMGGFVAATPLFSNRSLPNILKIFLTVILSLSVYFYAFSTVQTPEIEPLTYLTFILRETLLGLVMGFITQIVFTSVQIAGQFVDFQIGFSMSATYNPMSGTSQALMGRLYSVTALALVFATDAHHLVIRAMFKSFERIPLGMVVTERISVPWMTGLVSTFFSIALQIAVPVLLVMIMTDLVLGLVSRTVPSLNVLMLGMPLKIMVGMILSMAALPALIGGMLKIAADLSLYLDQWIQMLT